MVYENPDSDDGGSDDSMDRERNKYIKKKQEATPPAQNEAAYESGYLGSFLGNIK